MTIWLPGLAFAFVCGLVVVVVGAILIGWGSGDQPHE